MSSIMRWRNGLMGFSSIAKTPVSHGVEPHHLETVRTFAFFFSPRKLPVPRRGYHESGLVLAQRAVVPRPRGRRVTDRDGVPRNCGDFSRAKTAQGMALRPET